MRVGHESLSTQQRVDFARECATGELHSRLRHPARHPSMP
jgi:hypothetical protein